MSKPKQPTDLGKILPLAVAGLAVVVVIVAFFAAIKTTASGGGISQTANGSSVWLAVSAAPGLLLAGGLAALASFLPPSLHAGTRPFTAFALSAAGALTALFALFTAGKTVVTGTLTTGTVTSQTSVGIGLVLVLIVGLLQAAAAGWAWFAGGTAAAGAAAGSGAPATSPASRPGPAAGLAGFGPGPSGPGQSGPGQPGPGQSGPGPSGPGGYGRPDAPGPRPESGSEQTGGFAAARPGYGGYGGQAEPSYGGYQPSPSDAGGYTAGRHGEPSSASGPSAPDSPDSSAEAQPYGADGGATRIVRPGQSGPNATGPGSSSGQDDGPPPDVTQQVRF